MDSEARGDDPMETQSERGRDAMTGLRAIWAATGQMQQDDLGLECSPGEAGCTASVGFDGLADAVEPTTDTTEAIDRLRSAWKTTLAKDGKLYEGEGAPAPVERPPGE